MEFAMSYVVVVFMLNDLWWEVVARLVDIDGIIDHHYLNFPFIAVYFWW
jgi:hypothetical protein